jgi:VanZ family protein
MFTLKNYLSLWLPVLIWCGLIFFFSHRPMPEVMSESNTFNGIDIGYHFLAYFPLGYLIFRASDSLGFSILFCLFYGISDEVHQYFLPYRDFEWQDICVNFLSGSTGAYVYRRFIFFRL